MRAFLGILQILMVSCVTLAYNIKASCRPLNSYRQTSLPPSSTSRFNFRRQPCCPQMVKANAAIDKIDDKESSTYAQDFKITLFWVVAALIFSGAISMTMGSTSAIEFLSGYILEESLSVDNLFVFLVLFDYFSVGTALQSKVLNYGIIGAIVLRGLFISAGAVALGQFHQVLLLFAGVLFASSYGILAQTEEEEEVNNFNYNCMTNYFSIAHNHKYNPIPLSPHTHTILQDMSNNEVVKLSKRFFKSTDKFDGDK